MSGVLYVTHSFLPRFLQQAFLSLARFAGVHFHTALSGVVALPSASGMRTPVNEQFAVQCSAAAVVQDLKDTGMDPRFFSVRPRGCLGNAAHSLYRIVCSSYS